MAWYSPSTPTTESVKRQRLLAERLRSDENFAPGAGMHGQVYMVGGGPLGGIAKGLAAAYLGSKADQQEEALKTQQAATRQQVLGGLPQETEAQINQPSQAEIETGVPRLTTTPALAGRGLEQARAKYAMQNMLGSDDPILAKMGESMVTSGMERAGKDIELGDKRLDAKTANEWQVARDNANYEHMDESQKRQFDQALMMQTNAQNFQAGQNALQRALSARQHAESLSAQREAGGKVAPMGVTDSAGRPIFQDKSGNLLVLGDRGLQPTTGAGAMKPLTEGQAKELGYGDRMREANRQMMELQGKSSPMAIAAGKQLSNLPIVGAALANKVMGKESQQSAQAQRNFINAILRRESGAAISPSEFENAALQYFPQAGDSPEVIAQKMANQQSAIKGVYSGAGQQGMTRMQAAPAAPAARAQAPAAAIAKLKANPGLASAFKAKYGYLPGE